MNTELKTAFQYHLSKQFYNTYGPKVGKAQNAIALARADVEAGKRRYHYNYIHRPIRQSDGLTYLGDNPENFGLRFVGYVQVDCGYRNGFFAKDTRNNGWYCDDYQGETCYGVVYAMKTNVKGQSQYVAGYDFTDRDCGLVFDLNTIFSEPRTDGSHWDDETDFDAVRDAARHADSLAKFMAEDEREYSIAWHAGSLWAQYGDEVDTAKTELKGILAERRAVKGMAGFPALCKAIKGQVQALLSNIRKARASRSKLAGGDYNDLYFWNGDKRLQGAFNEGAGTQFFKGA